MADAHPLDPLLTRWSKHVKLSADDQEALLALPFKRKTFGKDAYLLREGQRVTDCALLLKGFAFRQKLLRDGSRQIISFHIPGEFVDLQNTLIEIADHNVQSLNRCDAAIIPLAALNEIAQARPHIRRAMWIETLIDASVFREWVVTSAAATPAPGSATCCASWLCGWSGTAQRVTAGSISRSRRSSLPTRPASPPSTPTARFSHCAAKGSFN